MASKTYLFSSIVLFSLLFIIVVLPYLTLYITYLGSLKSFQPGAKISYAGDINFWADHRDNRGVIDYMIDEDLVYYLDIDYKSDSIFASLRIYRVYNDSTTLMFNKTTSINSDSSLILFLLPHSNIVNITEYGYEISICTKPGPTRFGGLGYPSKKVGIPKEYLGALMLKKGMLIVTDDWWNEDWQCDVVKRHDTGVFFRYGKLENGYMLFSYASYYDAHVGGGNESIAEVFRRYGSPLINMLINTFEVDFLKDIVDKTRSCVASDIDVVRETAYIESSNVYPVDQDFYGGISGAYFVQTPISQLITMAAIILLILYYRRRV